MRLDQYRWNTLEAGVVHSAVNCWSVGCLSVRTGKVLGARTITRYQQHRALLVLYMQEPSSPSADAA